MPSNRQILDSIALAARSATSDAEFRALVIALIPPNYKPAARKPFSVRRDQRHAALPEPAKREFTVPPSLVLNARPGSMSYYYKLFRVKRADGRVTTVSVDPVLAEQAAQRLGGFKEVAALVRKLAFAYRKTDSVQSCSRFVSRELITAMASVSAGEPVR